MMFRRLVLSAILLTGLNLFSQTDSIAYPNQAKMEDGIYLNYDDFRRNKPITKEQIVSDMDKSQLEFIGKTIFNEKFSYKLNGETITTASKNAWGFFQNNTFYVNYKGDFYRIPVFGAISYLVANVTVVNPGFYDPRFGYSTGSSTSKEIREFVMNFYDGKVAEFNMNDVELLLERDPTLFAEYKKLSNRKQKEQVYRFIRKYNDLHPVYFLR
jgi:hypothetical protein